MDKDDLISIIMNMVSDEKLNHITLQDVRNIVGHLGPYLIDDEEGDVSKKDIQNSII